MVRAAFCLSRTGSWPRPGHKTFVVIGSKMGSKTIHRLRLSQVRQLIMTDPIMVSLRPYKRPRNYYIIRHCNMTQYKKGWYLKYNIILTNLFKRRFNETGLFAITFSWFYKDTDQPWLYYINTDVNLYNYYHVCSCFHVKWWQGCKCEMFQVGIRNEFYWVKPFIFLTHTYVYPCFVPHHNRRNKTAI